MLSCTSCQRSLPEELFSPDPRVPRGRQSHCRDCRSRRARDARSSEHAPTVKEGVRTCSACGKERPLEDFHLDAGAATGHRARCKACRTSRKHEHLEIATELACSRCGTSKPLVEFRVDSRRKNGHAPSCRSCEATAKAEARAGLSDRQRNAGDVPDGFRRCVACDVILPLEDFRQHIRGDLGRTRSCCSCLAKKERERSQRLMDPLDFKMRQLRERAAQRDEDTRIRISKTRRAR